MNAHISHKKYRRYLFRPDLALLVCINWYFLFFLIHVFTVCLDWVLLFWSRLDHFIRACCCMYDIDLQYMPVLRVVNVRYNSIKMISGTSRLQCMRQTKQTSDHTIFEMLAETMVFFMPYLLISKPS